MLDSASLVLYTTAYLTFEPFVERLKKGLTVLGEVAGVSLVEQLGLRYVDLIQAEDGEFIHKYIASSLHGFPLDRTIEKGAITHGEIRGRTKVGQLIAKYVQYRGGTILPNDLAPASLLLAKSPPTYGLTALLDVDHFQTESIDFEPEGIVQRMWSLHDGTLERSSGVPRPDADTRGFGIHQSESLSGETQGCAYVHAPMGKSFHPSTLQETHAVTPQDTVEQLAELRKIFGLKISELAPLLRVQRQTVYNWRKGQTLRPKSAKRLGELHSLAVLYRERGIGSTARYLHLPQDGAPTLFDLLTADILDKQAIVGLLDKILERRTRLALLSRIAAIVEEHRFEDVSAEEREANIEQTSF